ncbi:Uncharacterized protein dnm_083850 [Desulfonema magnum]|uniref:Uncharacterized protein n=1 Tax=Desulfonema magnum TaxID=45655 RepID=A0A975GSV0_9BACT|nr:Uncharacterized protein dnm_083850 [Desulfonema magnum]
MIICFLDIFKIPFPFYKNQPGTHSVFLIKITALLNIN